MDDRVLVQNYLQRLHDISVAASLVRRVIGYDTRTPGTCRLLISDQQGAALAIEALWHALRTKDDARPEDREEPTNRRTAQVRVEEPKV